MLAPVRQHHSKHKISEVVFDSEDGTEKTSQRVVTRFQHFHIERPHVPSGHPDDPHKISVSDPVFVNPATYKTVAEVITHVGKIARVQIFFRYQEYKIKLPLGTRVDVRRRLGTR